jgi:hypothetical protein
MRALVVLDEKVGSKELREALLDHLDGSTSEVFVVAPALADSTLKHVMGDIDEAIGSARERLESALSALRDAGLDVRPRTSSASSSSRAFATRGYSAASSPASASSARRPRSSPRWSCWR